MDEKKVVVILKVGVVFYSLLRLHQCSSQFKPSDFLS